MIFCTVTTLNYLPRAKVMAKSVKEHHPEAKVVVCLIEKKSSPDTVNCEWFDQVILAKELKIPDFHRLLFRCNISEASWMLKGELLQYLLRIFPKYNQIIYLDADTRLYGPLVELQTALKEHAIVLTPHVLHDTSTHYLWHGIFNAGFVAISQTKDAERFVQWWTTRLRRYCYKDRDLGLYDDQGWLKLAAFYFDVHILRHPGYNVAFWNLHERKVSMVKGNQYKIDQHQLRFFHYSFLSSNLKNKVEKACNKALRTLYIKYVEELEKEGLNSLSKKPWSYGYYINGKPIDDHSRKVYRNNSKLQIKYPSPFCLSNSFFLPEVNSARKNKKSAHLKRPRKEKTEDKSLLGGSILKERKQRYLIIASVGDHSRHQEWLKSAKYKNFELCLNYSGKNSGLYANQCDIYFQGSGPKWLKVKEIAEEIGDRILQYDAIWIPDDDICTDAKTISRMFEIFNEQGFDLAQPALSKRSYFNHQVTVENPAFKWRYSHFVDSMMPIFSTKAFQKCWPVFGKSSTSSGIDMVWPKILGHPNKKIAVIDETPVTSSRRKGAKSLNQDVNEREIEFRNIEKEYSVDRSIYSSLHFDGVPKDHNLIFAVLAHKDKHVLAEQVKNIRYFNPEAGIILYNGGINQDLSINLDVAECPYSRPIEWARQARVLLDVSKWLEENKTQYEFLVYLDHDVLFMKHGFEAFLFSTMKDLDCLGWRLLITSEGDKLPEWHTNSLEKELHIWRSFFGTDDLHCYFNPGQVYRRGIIRRILSAIDYSNAVGLIDSTNVFALEEMFFVTLASVCGGRIGEYPEGHSYNEVVTLNKNVTRLGVNRKRNNPYYYWIHPVKGKHLIQMNQWLLSNQDSLRAVKKKENKRAAQKRQKSVRRNRFE